MSHRSQRLSFVFSCIGHAYMHMFAAFYFVIVLAIEADWGLPYHQLVGLWTLGAVLVGLGALPAGWLGDRWSASGMMVVFFLGVGGAAMLCAAAGGPTLLFLGLSGIGLFASIYHPVGIAWLVRNSDVHRGKVIGVNGAFGGLGVGAAGIVAGGLIDLAGWRAAFLVPGAVSVATGLVLAVCLWRGWVRDHAVSRRPQPPESRSDTVRAFAALLLAMFLGAVIFHAMQTALPKVFALRLGALVGEGMLGVGALVAVVFGVGGLMQVAGGYLADRYPLKPVYAAAFLLQAPLLALAAAAGGLPLVGAMLLMITINAGAVPAENMLLARYTPERHHGVAFGAKFVLAFGAGPLALLLVAGINEATGEFYWLFTALAAMAAIGLLAALLLPQGRARRAPAAAPAE